MRSVALKLALVVLSALLALVVAEFALRIGNHHREPSPSLFRIPDPVLGWRLMPDAEFAHHVDGVRIPVEYNSEGWRDVEHDGRGGGDVARIVVLGDSFMEAYSVAFEDSFSARIERIAGEDGVKVEVFNLGVGGYGTLQEYLAFREYGRRLEPDLVLLGFYLGNDLRNNSRLLETAYRAGSDSMKVTSRPFLEPGGDPDRDASSPDFEGAVRRFEAARASATTASSWFTLPAIRSRLSRLHRASRGDSTGIDPDLRRLAKFGADYCRTTPEYDDAWAITRTILRRLNERAARSGARLVVFSVPEDCSVVPSRREERTKENPAPLCIEQAPAHARLGATLEDLGIPFVPLLQRFRSVARGDRVSLYNAGDRHWNAAGHDLAAREVFGYLSREELLP